MKDQDWFNWASTIFGFMMGCSENHEAIATALEEIWDILPDVGGDSHCLRIRVDKVERI